MKIPIDPVDSEFLEKREQMVSGLMMNGYLRTQKIIKVFMEVPRHVFVRDEESRFAYADYPLPIHGGQTISAPHMVAIMTELARPNAKDRILEIGAGSGYQAAILSKLVRKVYTVEIDERLAAFARANLAKTGIKNVEIIVGDGAEGYEKAKPYDKIIVTCATPEIFGAWVKQLKTGGLLLAPVGEGFYQELTGIRKTKKGLEESNYGGCAFVPLRR